MFGFATAIGEDSENLSTRKRIFISDKELYPGIIINKIDTRPCKRVVLYVYVGDKDSHLI